MDRSSSMPRSIREYTILYTLMVTEFRLQIVNLGDAFQKLTGGHYKSSLHRVINRSSLHRYSIPFFFDGNLDTVLKPVYGDDAGIRYLTVEEHMDERMSQSRKRALQTAN